MGIGAAVRTAAATAQQQLHLAAVAAARASKSNLNPGMGLGASQHANLGSGVVGVSQNQQSHVDRSASSAFRQQVSYARNITMYILCMFYHV